MARDKTFTAKLARAQGGEIYHTCQVCGEQFTMIKVVKSVLGEGKGGAMKFHEKVIKACKCNEKTQYDI